MTNLPWRAEKDAPPLAESRRGLIEEPLEHYEANRAVYMTSHQLADFRRSPLLWHMKHTGEIPDEDRPAFALGRALHVLVLEGEEWFNARYLVSDGPVNPRTRAPFGKTTKAYREWLEGQTCEVVSAADYDLLTTLREGVFRNAIARRLLAHGVPERVARAMYCEVPCQARLDWYNAAEGIVDLKTCDDLTWFEADARRYGYIHQMAFYRALVERVLGEVSPVHIIAVEKKAPYRCGVWEVPADALGVAQQENEEALAFFRECRQADCWPTGYEEQRILTL